MPTTYTGATKELVYTYANAPGAASTEVRNTTYNYGVAGAGTTASNVRGTVVNEVYAPPPKITFGHPSGGYAQTSTRYIFCYLATINLAQSTQLTQLLLLLIPNLKFKPTHQLLSKSLKLTLLVKSLKLIPQLPHQLLMLQRMMTSFATNGAGFLLLSLEPCFLLSHFFMDSE